MRTQGVIIQAYAFPNTRRRNCSGTSGLTSARAKKKSSMRASCSRSHPHRSHRRTRPGTAHTPGLKREKS